MTTRGSLAPCSVGRRRGCSPWARSSRPVTVFRFADGGRPAVPDRGATRRRRRGHVAAGGEQQRRRLQLRERAVAQAAAGAVGFRALRHALRPRRHRVLPGLVQAAGRGVARGRAAEGAPGRRLPDQREARHPRLARPRLPRDAGPRRRVGAARCRRGESADPGGRLPADQRDRRRARRLVRPRRHLRIRRRRQLADAARRLHPAHAARERVLGRLRVHAVERVDEHVPGAPLALSRAGRPS